MSGNRFFLKRPTAFSLKTTTMIGAILALLILDGLLGAASHSIGSASAPAPLGVPAASGTHAGLVPSFVAGNGAPLNGGGSPSEGPRPAASAPGWLDLTSYLLSKPIGRFLYGESYDTKAGYLVLFGGSESGTMVQDTWTYQKALWTDVSSSQTTTPGARYAPAMTFDAADNKTIMFGGYDASNSTYYQDTWAFANGTWSKLTLTTHPTPRWRSVMAYDAADGYVVMFGGTDSSGNALSDTWKFVGDKWTDITSSVSGSPVGHYRTAMTYDAADKEVVLFAGSTNSNGNSADTWVYSNLTWKLLTPSTSPTSRVYEFLCYDPSESAVIMYGGAVTSAGAAFDDTWKFSNGTWTNISSSVGTPPSWRGYGVAVYDPKGGYLVVYGGSDSGNANYYADTWTFDLSALVFASATPAATDVGIKTNISVEVLTGAKSLNYTYTELPTGCASVNQSWVICRPTQAGTYHITVYVNDTKGHSTPATLTLVVSLPPAVAAIQFNPSATTATVRAHVVVTASGGTGVLTYSYPKLPPGCSGLNTSNLACTPNKGGTFVVKAVAIDQVGGSGNRSANWTVAPVPTPFRFASSPPAIDYGQTALLYANVSGGTAPFSYLWTNVPAGCLAANLSPLPCKPSLLGSVQVSVKVSDRFGVSVRGTVNLTINTVMRLQSSGVSSIGIDVGTRLTFYTNVTGGTAPYNYTFSGSPGGCRFSNAAAAICTPTAAGTFALQATVTDTAGAQLYSAVFNVTVAAAPTVTGVTLGPKTIDLGQTSTITVNVSGGTAPFSFSYTGLPPGCAGSVEGSFACTPTSTGHFAVVVTAKDAVGKTVTGGSNLTVDPALKLGVLTLSPNSLSPGATLTVTVAVASAGTPPYTYRYSGLPAGCASSNVATLTCKPSATGTFKVLATVTDAAGASTSASATLSVVAASSSSTFLGLPPAEGYGLIAAVVAVVVVVAALLLMRGRSGKPSAAKGPPRAAPKKASAPAQDEEIYGSGGSSP